MRLTTKNFIRLFMFLLASSQVNAALFKDLAEEFRSLFVVPEALYALESYEPEVPHGPKVVKVSIATGADSSYYKRPELNDKINALPIADYRNVIDPKDDELMIEVNNQYRDASRPGIRIEHRNLYEALFSAAVESINVNRLRELIEMDLHRLLTAEVKISVFKSALEQLKNTQQVHPELFSLLLKNEFYSYNADLNSLLGNVLTNRNVLQAFLDYDPNFFRKIKDCNYVSVFLFDSKFTKNTDIIDVALNIGCDPSIIRKGQNTLDMSLDLRASGYPNRSYLDNLISKLENDYNLRESDTLMNIWNCCLYKRPDSALRLLRTGRHVPGPDDSYLRGCISACCPKTPEFQRALEEYLRR